MLRRTKAEVLDLPPKLRTWLNVELPRGIARKETRRVFELLIAGQLERNASAGNGAGRTKRGGKFQDRTRLLASLTKARVTLARAKAGETIKFVEDCVEQDEKVIVFSCFDEPVTKIAKHFGQRAVLLTGKTPTARRQALVDRFQSDPEVKVFVANIIAGGVGINLTAARQVVFNDLDWVPANHWQAEDRAYRIGQSNTVNVTYMSATDTIDGFVSATLQVKAMLVEAVVDGGFAGEGGTDLLTDLEQFFKTLTPSIATLNDGDSDEDAVDRLIREVTERANRSASERSGEGSTRRVSTLSDDAIMALAKALAGPESHRYRVSSSSRPGSYYHLDVDGSDVTCTCPGFEYRGACRHARSLKDALAKGAVLPDGIELDATI
jgi:hypothetical protein